MAADFTDAELRDLDAVSARAEGEGPKQDAAFEKLNEHFFVVSIGGDTVVGDEIPGPNGRIVLRKFTAFRQLLADRYALAFAADRFHIRVLHRHPTVNHTPRHELVQGIGGVVRDLLFKSLDRPSDGGLANDLFGGFGWAQIVNPSILDQLGKVAEFLAYGWVNLQKPF